METSLDISPKSCRFVWSGYFLPRAFTIGPLEPSDLATAAEYGIVAAGFALERTGLPIMDFNCPDGMELWDRILSLQISAEHERSRVSLTPQYCISKTRR